MIYSECKAESLGFRNFTTAKELMLNPADPITYIDSHVHLDIIADRHPERITWLKQTGCIPISWAFGCGIKTHKDLQMYLQRQQKTIHRLSAQGLPCFYLTGIHPRNIPSGLSPDAVSSTLLPSLDDERCLGIGEIGLETGAPQELQIFSAQLAMLPEVVRRNKIVGVHTPRMNKQEITDSILSLLHKHRDCAHAVVIDHCTEKTIGRVLQEGYWAGITLSPQKTSVAELEHILATHQNGYNRIMLNTDSGSELFDDLHGYAKTAPNTAEAQRLFRDNARLFFNLKG